MDKEIWKNVIGYEQYYEVSNFGQIRRKERILIHKDGKKYLYKSRLLGIRKSKNGYSTSTLTINNKSKTLLVHRIVAHAFISNPNNLPCVNHIDGNKQNNCVDNLEWCTYSYNIYHAYINGLRYQNKKVLQYDLQGNFIKEWNSISQAQYELKIFHIKDVCVGKRHQCGGYIWKLANK